MPVVHGNGRFSFEVAVLGIMVLLSQGCSHRSINHILAVPDMYGQREVAVSGTVVESYSILGRGAYRIDDGTGQLWIVTKHNAPRKGARVGVKGKIKNGFDLGGVVKLPEKFSSGLVMVETSHKAKG